MEPFGRENADFTDRAAVRNSMKEESEGESNDRKPRAKIHAKKEGEENEDESKRPRAKTDGKESTDNSLNDKKWDEMFGRLQSFKKRTGHCSVPNRYADDPQLGTWVSAQRRKFQNFHEGDADIPLMKKQRMERLQSIGFLWSANPRQASWEQNYEELVAFKNKYGHSQVPIGWEENAQLSNWVSTQRQQYKFVLKGQSSNLTDKRIKLLNSVDFVWEAQRGGPRREKRATVQVPLKANPVQGFSIHNFVNTENKAFLNSEEPSQPIHPARINLTDETQISAEPFSSPAAAITLLPQRNLGIQGFSGSSTQSFVAGTNFDARSNLRLDTDAGGMHWGHWPTSEMQNFSNVFSHQPEVPHGATAEPEWWPESGLGGNIPDQRLNSATPTVIERVQHQLPREEQIEEENSDCS